MKFRTVHSAIAACWLLMPGLASGQMVTTQSPLQQQTASFYQSSHVGWSVHNPHYFMSFNGGALPPYGGYQPNAGLQSRMAFGNSQLNFGFGQGASLGSTTVAPSLTTTNGFPGYLFIGDERPFVTGVTPVVAGNFTSVPPVGPLAARIATGQLRIEDGRLTVPAATPADVARRPVPVDAGDRALAIGHGRSVPGTRDATSKALSAEQHLQRGIAAQKEGRAGVARIYFQLAAANGNAIIKSEATRRLESLTTR